jgi:hypothetical protein
MITLVTHRPSIARLAAAAGLAYIAGISIENMTILEAPTVDSPVGEIRAAYADEALQIVSWAAGVFALFAYCGFAVALYARLRRGGGRWALVGLIGGIGGPVIAAVGLTASVILIARVSELSDDEARDLLELNVNARIVSGVFVALFLAGFGMAALRTAALPRPLALFACALAVPMALAPIAAIAESSELRLAVTLAFSCQSLWIFAVSTWLLFGSEAPATFVRRTAFLLLVLAAGLIGLALLAAPGATGKFFSWGLGPEPLAAFAGGVYVGAAAVYAAGLMRPWTEARGLVAGAVVLSVSVLVATLVHLELFDFDRLQAWAWLVLFAGFSAVTTALLAIGGREEPQAPTARPVRVLLGVVAVVLAPLALALWVDPTALSGASPFALAPMGGRFAGSWVALVAVLAGWAAWRGGAAEARFAGLALVALPAGALLAALRTASDLDGGAPLYVAALVLLVLAGVRVLTSLRVPAAA